ncbi:MAG TPA: hypothetical protein VGC66_00730 [Pyrinomonadaceae bacterium]|jgi:hypothetical protein
MPLDFNILTPRIERLIHRLKVDYSHNPGMILTEDDLQCHLHGRLSRLRAFRYGLPTQDSRVLGFSVHSELTWYDERRKLRIKPDITILEPEEMSIQHGYVSPMLEPFCSSVSAFHMARPLPSKQYEFGGNAITFELKFARNGITEYFARLIKQDFKKMMRLFEILDRRGEGESIFSYLIIFNKLPQPMSDTPLAQFMNEHGSGPRHKILYKTCSPCPSLVLTNPPFAKGTWCRAHGAAWRRR